MQSRILSLLLTALFAAGCLAGTSGDDDPTGQDPVDPLGWVERAVAGGDDHDHRDLTQHQNRSTSNFDVLGWEPLVTDYHGTTSAGHLCGGNAEKDGRVLTVVHSFVSDVAVIIVDTTDPAAPQKIGELSLPYTHVYDLTITPDQQHVLLATTQDTETDGGEPLRAPLVVFRDACTGETRVLEGPEQNLPYWHGLVLIDISDPKAPAVEDYLNLGGGHSVQAAELDGRTYALVTTSTFALVEIVETTGGSKLVPVMSHPYGNCGAEEAAPQTCNYHDGFIQKHPVTGQSLVYLATSDALVIYDIENPNVPTVVGRWDAWGELGAAAPTNPFLHEAYPLDHVRDGRHYTITGEECLAPREEVPSCLALVLDTTDPADPQFVAAWTHPIEIEAYDQRLLFSLHYVAVVDQTLFVANYHGGLWAVDLANMHDQASLPTIGVFMPDHLSPKPVGRATAYDWAPAVLDVLPQPDGSLVVLDHTSGLYTARFDASDPMPSPTPWPIGTD